MSPPTENQVKSVPIIDSITVWSGKIIAFFVVLAAVIVVVEVVLRYAFNSPTKYGLELTIFLCSILYVMGGAWVYRQNEHVSIDIFYRRWSPKTRAIIDLILLPLLIVFCGMLVWKGGMWTFQAFTTGETSLSIWAPIIWPIRLLIPLSSFLVLLQVVARVKRDLTIAFTRGNPG